MGKNTGNALPQYVIVIALIAIALTPVFFSLGNILVGQFSSLQSGLIVSEPVTNNTASGNSSSTTETNDTTSTTNTNVVAGSLGGTPSNPAKKCAANTCTIDYGDYVLSGVPENFGDFLQTSGPAGGTETIVAVIEELIAAAKAQQITIDSALLQDLANYGHEIAGVEKELEAAAQYILDNPTDLVAADVKTPTTQLTSSTKRSMFDKTLEKVNDPEYFPINDQKDEDVKTLVNILATEIQKIADNMSALGEQVPSGYEVPPELVEAVLHPKASLYTDLDSAIICTTGDKQDSGTKCN